MARHVLLAVSPIVGTGSSPRTAGNSTCDGLLCFGGNSSCALRLCPWSVKVPIRDPPLPGHVLRGRVGDDPREERRDPPLHRRAPRRSQAQAHERTTGRKLEKMPGAEAGHRPSASSANGSASITSRGRTRLLYRFSPRKRLRPMRDNSYIEGTRPVRSVLPSPLDLVGYATSDLRHQPPRRRPGSALA